MFVRLYKRLLRELYGRVWVIRLADEQRSGEEYYHRGLVEIEKWETQDHFSRVTLKITAEPYRFLNFSVGDTVRIIDNYTRTQISRRIVEITEHPFEPDKNSCVIGDTRPNYEELIESIHYSTGAITNPYDLTSGTELDLTSSNGQDDSTDG